MVKVLSVEECLKLMDEYGMPDNIKFHSFKVRDISVYLTKELNKKGENLNGELTESSALLHDIAKISCVSSGKRHDKNGAEILKNLGYDRIAEIIEQHINLRQKHEKITEEEIVNYADKRVMHDKLVSLSERFEDVKKRYASGDEDVFDMISTTEEETYVLEKKIFKKLDFSPDDLADLT